MVRFHKMALSSTIREELFQMMTDKNKIEADILQYMGVLSSHNVGMNEPLVDNEGFPRNDIDVYEVRIARHKIICLKNDLKALMIKVEKHLHKVHAEDSGSPRDMPMNSKPLPIPFACVTSVTPTSPAALCGLDVDDLIVEFGSVNKSNYDSMEDLAIVVRHSEGQKVKVVVRRRNRRAAITLELTPKAWDGPGLLGCKIEPLPVEFVER